MREYSRVILQYMDTYSRAELSAAGAVRDLFMADNLRHLAAREPANTRFIIWAHNGHIMTNSNRPTNLPFGYHLRRFYGKEYYAVGFSFNQGSFQAMEEQPKDPQKVVPISFTVNPAPAESIDWYLAETKAKTIFVDLRSAANDKTVAEWMAVAHPMRAIGATYDVKNENKLLPTVLQQSFDGLFFIDTTTRARPNH
jgi:erythromycin esterase